MQTLVACFFAIGCYLQKPGGPKWGAQGQFVCLELPLTMPPIWHPMFR
jgi:hypothetical protein